MVTQRQRRQEQRKLEGIYGTQKMRRPYLPTGPGTPPGSLVIPEDAHDTKISILAYGPEAYAEHEIDDPRDLQPVFDAWPVTWISVCGLKTEATLIALQQMFNIHRLVLEDILNGEQRAKIEAYDDAVFIVARAPQGGGGRTQQVSLWIQKGIVVTFFEEKDEWFEPVKERIRGQIGTIREVGTDYLTYAILDALIDAYYPIIDTYGERLERLEREVLSEPTELTVHRVHAIKRALLRLRRSVWPHRELINSLLRDHTDLVQQRTELYLRDCYDHLVRLAELIESQRELCSDLMNTYLSSISNKMNEVMKVLTIIATIFIPITFVAGVYGMNFDPEASRFNMPELRWLFGYPATLGIMGAIAGGMIVFFWRRGWFK
jgi:magnesium transporter